MKPFLKWAGGKYRIVDKIKEVLPSGKRLIEPFAGSAAVFLNTNYADNFISDSNADIINIYAQLQDNGKSFIDYCKTFFVKKNNVKERFYEFREQFNQTSSLSLKAALFLYLNRHCFNGLCRYNSKGGFNVPFGKYAAPYFPNEEMHYFYNKSKHATFVCADFKAVIAKAKRGDVVYCDPPYVPLSRTANFTSYTSGGFGQTEQQQLADIAERLQSKGIPIVISNHNTAFTRNAYKLAEIKKFDVQRFISSDGNNRGSAQELLAVFS
ncbi:MAG: Dam family site-specific DNA-(adenine-N6)-methyltransferase [Alphaproteobacteria bacterium]|nr:Dam family site-specific DNA-(adenine-N6)-methyltransferase [Alphaproteobacteria bacterium]